MIVWGLAFLIYLRAPSWSYAGPYPENPRLILKALPKPSICLRPRYSLALGVTQALGRVLRPGLTIGLLRTGLVLVFLVYGVSCGNLLKTNFRLLCSRICHVKPIRYTVHNASQHHSKETKDDDDDNNSL